MHLIKMEISGEGKNNLIPELRDGITLRSHTPEKTSPVSLLLKGRRNLMPQMIGGIILAAVFFLAGDRAYSQAASEVMPDTESKTGTDTKPVQEKTAVPKVETPAKPESPPVPAAVPAVRDETKEKKPAKTEQPAQPVIKTAEPKAAQREKYGLLPVDEGDFKYKRIPEINIPEKTGQYKTEKDILQEELIAGSDIEIPAHEKKDEEIKKGIFGIGKKTMDTIIIIVLLAIIIVVVLMLKVKSKDKGGNVLRRFPGSQKKN